MKSQTLGAIKCTCILYILNFLNILSVVNNLLILMVASVAKQRSIYGM